MTGAGLAGMHGVGSSLGPGTRRRRRREKKDVKEHSGNVQYTKLTVPKQDSVKCRSKLDRAGERGIRISRGK